MSIDNRALILSCRETIRRHRRLKEEHCTLAAQMRQQIDQSLEILRQSKTLPGLKYASHVEPLPRQHRAAPVIAAATAPPASSPGSRLSVPRELTDGVQYPPTSRKAATAADRA